MVGKCIIDGLESSLEMLVSFDFTPTTTPSARSNLPTLRSLRTSSRVPATSKPIPTTAKTIISPATRNLTAPRSSVSDSSRLPGNAGQLRQPLGQRGLAPTCVSEYSDPLHVSHPEAAERQS